MRLDEARHCSVTRWQNFLFNICSNESIPISIKIDKKVKKTKEVKEVKEEKKVKEIKEVIVEDSVFKQTEKITKNDIIQIKNSLKPSLTLADLQAIGLKLSINIVEGSTKTGKPKNKTKSELLEEIDNKTLFMKYNNRIECR